MKQMMCYLCGRDAKFQLKNGKWCCSKNARSCPAIKNKIRSHMIQRWKEVKTEGKRNLNTNKKPEQFEPNVCSFCGGHAEYKLKNGKWCCSAFYQSCPALKEKNSKSIALKHESKGAKWFPKGFNAWNKGLTKETDERIRKGAEKHSQKIKEGLVIPSQTGKPLSEETKKKISDSMKKAHKEKRAHNIGECRWNNKPSYPESFFIKVIQNEFFDKKYTREYPFFKYSIDFAWVDKKLAIEIDGEQHETDIQQKHSDMRKDELLKENGWNILRIKW